MKSYVDTHCHLDSLYQSFKLPIKFDFDEVMKKWEPGLDACITNPLYSMSSFEPWLAKNHPKIYFQIGIHPLTATQYGPEMEKNLNELAKLSKVVAIGEIGLDKYKGADEIEIQKKAFISQIAIAVSYNLPICIHSRRADDDTLKILKEHVPPNHKVHMHCFSGSLKFCKKLLKQWNNLYFGFTGDIIYSERKTTDDVIKHIPLERIIAESDAPFMRPPDWHEEVSSPGLVPSIIRKIAEIKGINEDDAFAQLRNNCKDLYGV